MNAHADPLPATDGDAFETDAFARAMRAKTQELLADPDVRPDALLLVADALVELNETYAEALNARKRAMTELNGMVGRLRAEAARRARPPGRTVPTVPYYAH